MQRTTILFALALCAGSGCDPESNGGGTTTTTSSSGSGGDTSAGGSPSSSAGTGGSAASTGGSAASTGGSATTGTGASGGTGGAGGACEEDGPFPTPSCGQNGPVSKCHCADEVMDLLAHLQSRAAAHHEAAGQSCGGAVPVPATIPAGTYYVPGTSDGCDFHTGDAETGWICLDAAMPPIVHCQYSYTLGSAPIAEIITGGAVALGAQDFEIAALGDDDGDIAYSYRSVIGRVDPSGQLTFDPVLVKDPGE